MSALPILPVIVPLLFSAFSILAHRTRSVQRVLSLGAGGVVTCTAGILLWSSLNQRLLAVQLGGHPAPFGISFVADTLSSVMTLVSGVVGLAVVLYRDEEAEQSPVFHPLLLALLAGVSGAFLTGDLFNFYVWFEVTVVASLGLLVLGNRPEQIDAAVKYAVLNILAATVLLIGIGLVYAVAGTLNFADLAVVMPEVQDRGVVLVAALTLFVALAAKAAVFPLFFWLPASYHTAGFAVSALLSGLLTKVGVYALYRVFLTVFPGELSELRTLLIWISGFTMVTGVLGAAAHQEIRRILSFHIISQIGYLLLGLALATPLGIAGGLFYMVHVVIAKVNLFLIGGLIARLGGTSELSGLGGLLRVAPGLSLLFAISAGSIAGVPPFSGFWAKLTVVLACLETQAHAIAVIALAVGVLTLYSMTKIWQSAFWGAAPQGWVNSKLETVKHRALPAALLAAGLVGVGFYPAPLLTVAHHAANQMLNPLHYASVVRGGSP